MRTLLLASAVLAAASGCAVRSTPYRFAGPLVSGVSLDDRAEHGRRPRHDDAVTRTSRIAVAEVPGAGRPEVPSSSDGHDVSGATTIHGGPLTSADGSTGVVISRLPEPHRQDRAKDGETRIDLSSLDEVDELRALVGHRDGRGHLGFALAAAAQLAPAAVALDDDAARTGPELVELARQRGVLGDPEVATVEPGDLLVFDRATDDEPASLVAIVLGRDDRGVVEMLYLARGVVRRGFVDPTRPHTRRDRDARVVNTYLRHTRDQPPKGTRYLAGELLAHVIHVRGVAPVGVEPTLERF